MKAQQTVKLIQPHRVVSENPKSITTGNACVHVGVPRKTVFIDGAKWAIVSGIEYHNHESIAWTMPGNVEASKIHYRLTTRTITMDVRSATGEQHRLTVHPFFEETPKDLVPVSIVFDPALAGHPEAFNAWVQYDERPHAKLGLVEITPTERHFYTVPAAAAYAEKHPETISKWIKDGLLPCAGYTPGKKLVRISVKASDIDLVKRDLAPKKSRPKARRR